MSLFSPAVYFRYIVKLYTKHLIFILLGLSLTFAVIEFFQNLQFLETTLSNKILYIFYIWQESLKLLYPLSIVFALIMTKIFLIKSNNMSALYALGYTNKNLIKPFLLIAMSVYVLFAYLNTTDFAYAKEKATAIINKKLYDYNVQDIFFKYQDTFVYMKRLYPIEKKIKDITIFKVKDKKVLYTIHAPYAIYDGFAWEAKKAVIKTHNYHDNKLISYTQTYQPTIKTLKGYKPKIISSLYEGKALNIVDAYHTYNLLEKEHINTNKIKTHLYTTLVVPLFAPILVMILFIKLPYLSRYSNQSFIIALSLGGVLMIWGIFIGLSKIASSGNVIPELALVFPIFVLFIYALYLYFFDEKKI